MYEGFGGPFCNGDVINLNLQRGICNDLSFLTMCKVSVLRKRGLGRCEGGRLETPIFTKHGPMNSLIARPVILHDNPFHGGRAIRQDRLYCNLSIDSLYCLEAFI